MRVHLPRERKVLQVARVFQVTGAGRDAPPKDLFDGAHERLFRGHCGRGWRAHGGVRPSRRWSPCVPLRSETLYVLLRPTQSHPPCSARAWWVSPGRS